MIQITSGNLQQNSSVTEWCMFEYSTATSRTARLCDRSACWPPPQPSPPLLVMWAPGRETARLRATLSYVLRRQPTHLNVWEEMPQLVWGVDENRLAAAPHPYRRWRHEGASFNLPANGSNNGAHARNRRFGKRLRLLSRSRIRFSICAARPRSRPAIVARARLVPRIVRPAVAALERVRSVDDNGSARATPRTFNRSQRTCGARGRLHGASGVYVARGDCRRVLQVLSHHVRGAVRCAVIVRLLSLVEARL